jgi:hypothetical protein
MVTGLSFPNDCCASAEACCCKDDPPGVRRASIADCFEAPWSPDGPPTLEMVATERDMLRDQNEQLRDDVFHLRSALHELLLFENEAETIGGGPNYRERRAAAVAFARETYGEESP